uniref:Ubiquitin-like domain-containing protein n=1 Tax=Heterorhabditis bacteriophora TaxID=37862 RepID=A0A1I7XS70_HETBA
MNQLSLFCYMMVVTVCVTIVVTVFIFFVTLAAWQSTARRPLYYDLFLVEMHTWVSRRFVQVLHLGQEFRPRGSWGDVMARMRSRSRRQPERESDQTLLSDTNVVIQSPATVVDGNVAIIHFASEVSAGRIVRLIYQGQLLRDDSRSLASYGLQDGCVVHCHVSNTPYAQPTSTIVSPSRSSETVSRQRRVTMQQRREEEVAMGDSTVNSELRYPRWAIALLLHTYHIPLIGAPMDALVRFLFDPPSIRNSQSSGLIRGTYRRFHNAVFGAYRPRETVHNLDTAADAASRPRPQHICLGDYLLWIFAGQFVAVWGFVYCFPQLCDRTALGLLVLLTLYFFFVVCRSREMPEQQNHSNSHLEGVR